MRHEQIWRNGVLTWNDPQGALCISVVFTWHLPIAKSYANAVPGKVRIGGPAVELARTRLPGFFLDCRAEVGGDYPGVLQMWNPHATRTSIGCIRKCAFCSVPLVEGQRALDQHGARQVPLADWIDAPIICDNNLLANPVEHFDKVCDRLERWPWSDFNQGTDARLLTEHHAERIARFKNHIMRLALDSMTYADQWEAALETLLKAGVPKRAIRTYCLMGFGTSPDESWRTCEFIERHGIKPLPMWFHELDALERNIVTDRQKELGWNDYERRRLMQWFYQHKKAVGGPAARPTEAEGKR